MYMDLLGDLVSLLSTEDNVIANLSSIFTVSALIIAPAVWAVKRKVDTKNRRSLVAKRLYAELNNVKKALRGTKYKVIEKIIIDPNPHDHPIKVCKRTYYTLVSLNHDAYDSAVHSGQIMELDVDTLKSVQDIFRLIKERKEYDIKIHHLLDEEYIRNRDMNLIISRYYEFLAKNEKTIDEMLDVVMEKLRKNF